MTEIEKLKDTTRDGRETRLGMTPDLSTTKAVADHCRPDF
jgi:hypothetical protein